MKKSKKNRKCNRKTDHPKSATRLRVENKLIDYCQGYDIENFSVGRIITFMAEHKNLGLNLSTNELRELGIIVREKKKYDFEESYITLSNLIYNLYGRELPDLDNKLWHKPQTEYEYLEFIANQPYVTTGKIPQSTLKRIKAVKNKTNKDNPFLGTANHLTQMYVMNPKLIGIPLNLLAIREKTEQSLIVKSIERISQIFFPEDEETLKLLSQKNISQELFQIFCDDLIRNSMLCGNDFQTFYQNQKELYKNFMFTIAGQAVSRRYLVDAGGFKISGPPEQIAKINKHIALDSESENPVYRGLKYQEKNYFKAGKKDLAIVRPCRGNRKGTYLEIRLQPFRESLLLADFGADETDIKVEAHPIYKSSYTHKLIWRKNNSEQLMDKSNQICIGMGYRLDDLLNYYSNLN